MKIFVLFSTLLAVSYAEQCVYGEAGSQPQSLVTCKSVTTATMGNNIKLNDKSGPFESVTDLELTNFTGTLDSNTLSMFPKLKRLSIQDSNFPKISSVVFEKCCKDLKILSIRNNMATTIEAGTFKNMKELEELHLSNKIPKLSKDLLEGLVVLKKLTLRKTKINEVDEDAFENMKTLETLELYDNTFPVIKPKTFAPLTELNKLSILDNPNLKLFPLDLLKEQKKLELLGLPVDILSKIEVTTLKKQFPSLKKLEIKVDDKKKYENMLQQVEKEQMIISYLGDYV